MNANPWRVWSNAVPGSVYSRQFKQFPVLALRIHTDLALVLANGSLTNSMAVITRARSTNDGKAALILAAIAISEGTWVVLNIYSNARGFFRFSGMLPFRGNLSGWILAILVAVVFVYQLSRFPSVRANLVRPSFLKLLGIGVAVASGFCEEIVFRKMWMDYLQRHGSGVGLQILFSALGFGLAHSVWALFRGSVWAGLAATIATGVLGLGLAIVYVVSDRAVAACIVSHFLINLLAEPGLVLAAVRGEMRGH